MFLPIRLPSDLSHQPREEEDAMAEEGGYVAGKPERSSTGSGSMGYLRKPQDKTFNFVSQSGALFPMRSIDLHARYTKEELDQMFRKRDDESDSD
jgi:hypothetical protein